MRAVPVTEKGKHGNGKCAASAREELDDGEILAVHMNDGEPVQNVPRSIKEDGHQILKLIDNGDSTYDLIVRKVGD